MATPFENWFSSDWNKMLHDLPSDREVLSNGFDINTASWDRRAAYLHWVTLGRPNAAWAEIYPLKVGRADQDDDDLLAGPVKSPKPASPKYDDEDLLS